MFHVCLILNSFARCFGSVRPVKTDATFFALNTETFFCNLHCKISPLRVSKKYWRLYAKS
jgi:hypothetical protein